MCLITGSRYFVGVTLFCMLHAFSPNCHFFLVSIMRRLLCLQLEICPLQEKPQLAKALQEPDHTQSFYYVWAEPAGVDFYRNPKQQKTKESHRPHLPSRPLHNITQGLKREQRRSGDFVWGRPSSWIKKDAALTWLQTHFVFLLSFFFYWWIGSHLQHKCLHECTSSVNVVVVVLVNRWKLKWLRQSFPPACVYLFCSLSVVPYLNRWKQSFLDFFLHHFCGCMYSLFVLRYV